MCYHTKKPRLCDVTNGCVRIDDIDVRDLSLHSLGDVVGMVTQVRREFWGDSAIDGDFSSLHC